MRTHRTQRSWPAPASSRRTPGSSLSSRRASGSCSSAKAAIVRACGRCWRTAARSRTTARSGRATWSFRTAWPTSGTGSSSAGGRRALGGQRPLSRRLSGRRDRGCAAGAAPAAIRALVTASLNLSRTSAVASLYSPAGAARLTDPAASCVAPLFSVVRCPSLEALLVLDVVEEAADRGDSGGGAGDGGVYCVRRAGSAVAACPNQGPVASDERWDREIFRHLEI